MTAATLIAQCEAYKQENGIMATLDLLADISASLAQSAGVVMLDEEFDEMEVAYFTVQ